VRDVEEAGAWRPRRRLPVLGAGRGRAYVAHDLAEHRRLFVVDGEAARREIHAAGGVDVREGGRREHLAGRPVHDVDVAVALGPHEDLTPAALEVEVDEDLLVHGVVVEHVVRRQLIGPYGFAGGGPAREDRVGPLVVAGPLLGVPRAGVRGAVVDEVEVGVVGDPAPHRPAADLPRFRRPRRDAELGHAVRGVERPEARTDQHVAVRAGAVRAPRDRTRREVERRQPAADAELPAAITDEHPVADDQRRHRHRLAAVDVAELRAPQLTSRPRVDRHRLCVERVEDDAAVGVGGAAIDGVAAGDALRRRRRLRLVLPAHGAVTTQIERPEDVRVGRDDVERVADDEGGRFLAPLDARMKAPGEPELPDIGRGNLRQAAIAGGGVVASGSDPLTVVGVGLRPARFVGPRLRRQEAGRHRRHDGDGEPAVPLASRVPPVHDVPCSPAHMG